MSRFSKLSKKGTFSCFACRVNNEQPQRRDWSEHCKRSCDCIAVSPLLVPQMFHWSCPHLGCLGMHRQQGCTRVGCPGACPLPWEAGADQSQLPHSSQGGAGKWGHSREEFQFCHLQKSLWEFDMLGMRQVSKARGILESLVPVGYERQEELCWQMMSPVRSCLHPATAANQCWLCAAQILYCWNVCVYKNLCGDHCWDVITCQNLQHRNGTSWCIPISCHGLSMEEKPGGRC